MDVFSLETDSFSLYAAGFHSIRKIDNRNEPIDLLYENMGGLPASAKNSAYAAKGTTKGRSRTPHHKERGPTPP
jgi:hypothetical protein